MLTVTPLALRVRVRPVLTFRARRLLQLRQAHDESSLPTIELDEGFKPYNKYIEETENNATDEGEEGSGTDRVRRSHSKSSGPSIGSWSALIEGGTVNFDRPRTVFSEINPQRHDIFVASDLHRMQRDALHFGRARAAPGTRMNGRRVFIAGGASGIGLAMAKKFVLEGADSVGILSRSQERLKSAIDSITSETGLADAPIWGLHSLVNGEIKDIFTNDATGDGGGRTETVWPTFNTLINCLGRGQSRLLLKTKPQEVHEILSINLKSNILFTRFFLSSWTKALHFGAPYEVSPCILNVSSLLAQKGASGTSVYAAAKAGMIALSRTCVVEAKDLFEVYSKDRTKPPGPRLRLRVNTLVPGFIDTPMTDSIAADKKELIANDIPMGRFGTAEECADAALFLVTNEYANNCVLNLDGGLSAG